MKNIINYALLLLAVESTTNEPVEIMFPKAQTEE